MKKQVNFQLKEATHIAAKKRIADLKINFSDYLDKLITLELNSKFLDKPTTTTQDNP